MIRTAEVELSLIEEEIRPAELMQRQRELVLTDVGRMLSRYSEFVAVNCPACDCPESRLKYEKRGISYDECSNCATIFVNPRPSPEVLEWFYRGSPNYAYWNSVIFPASEAARRGKIFVPRVDRVLDICSRLGVPTDSLIEVGAGFGTFCEELSARGVFRRIVAIEPTPDLADSCRKRGIDVREAPIEKVCFEHDEQFDIAANFEVIEHLFDPGGFIAEMARVLRPEGVLVLTCPNGQGFDVEALGPLSDTVDHEHLNYFNPQSMPALLARHGFETVELTTPGMLDAELVRKKAQSGTYDLSKQPFLEKLLIRDWDRMGPSFQQFLIDNQLSSNMWVVARKAKG